MRMVMKVIMTQSYDTDNDNLDLNLDTDLNSVYDSNVDNSQHQAQDVDDTSDMGSGANDCSSDNLFSFIVTILWLACNIQYLANMYTLYSKIIGIYNIIFSCTLTYP